MVRSRDNTERLIYCSGGDWSGDGSKASSPCRFGQSKLATVKRYKCAYCATGQSPEGIYADANGVRKMIPNNAPVQDEPIENSQSDSPGTSEVKVAPATPVEKIEEKVENPEKSVRKTKIKRRRPRF